MATTQLADVIEPSTFTSYVIERTAELSALVQSGIVVLDSQLDGLAKGPSSLINMPFWQDLGTDESNVGSDDPASDSTPKKITASKDVSIKHLRNQSWSSADMVSALNGSDPLLAIGNLVGGYWARDLQRTLIAELTGVLADNVANDSGDMLYSVALDTVPPILDAEKISATVVLTAAQTMGDSQEKLTAIGMHSVVYSNLLVQDLITFIRPSQGGKPIPTYLGYTVVVDDMFPAVAGSNRITYTTVLFGAGAYGYGVGSPRTPTAVSRDEDAGDGEGIETLHNRQHFIMHPRGVKFVDGSMAGLSPTNAEAALAANWDRVYSRKNVRMAFIQTNG